jgi:hypothetical protein
MATITASSRVAGQNGYGAPPLMNMMPLFSRGKFQLAFARSWSYNSTGAVTVGSFTVPTLTTGQSAVYFVTFCSSFVYEYRANEYRTGQGHAYLSGAGVDQQISLTTGQTGYLYQHTNGQLHYPVATQAIGTSATGLSGQSVSVTINNTTWSPNGYPYSHINVVCFVYTPAAT